MIRTSLVLAAIAFAGLTSASAQDNAVKERQDLMENVGKAAKLGSQMVKGEKEFDAAAAAEAMQTISGSMDEFVTLFPEGTAVGEVEETEAKPEIWQNIADFESKAQDTEEAAANASEATSEGLDAFKAAFVEMGKSCGACHEDYRVKDN